MVTVGRRQRHEERQLPASPRGFWPPPLSLPKRCLPQRALVMAENVDPAQPELAHKEELHKEEVPPARFELCMLCYLKYTEKESKAATRIQAKSRKHRGAKRSGL